MSNTKKTDPRPTLPKLDKLPSVADIDVYRALRLALAAAPNLAKYGEYKSVKALVAKGEKAKGLTRDKMDSYATIALTIASVERCREFIKKLGERLDVTRAYSIELACWKKRNGKAMTKEERLLVAICADDDGNLVDVKATAPKSAKNMAKRAAKVAAKMVAEKKGALN